nr:MAG TPA: hypothetical protein [Caudoviricetes sp.]
MIYFKTNNTEYLASIAGKMTDRDWGNRESKAITLEMTYENAAQLFVDGLSWSIVQKDTVPVYDESGNPTGETTEQAQEWDNSDYNVAGSITDNRNGTCTCKMGKKTMLEKEQELRQDAETAAKILLGEEA